MSNRVNLCQFLQHAPFDRAPHDLLIRVAWNRQFARFGQRRRAQRLAMNGYYSTTTSWGFRKGDVVEATKAGRTVDYKPTNHAHTLATKPLAFRDFPVGGFPLE